LQSQREVPDYLKGFITFAYKSGWRVSEITGLKWSNVDLNMRIVKREVGITKNKEGRTIYLNDELMDVFMEQRNNQKESKQIIHHVFTNRKGDGNVKDFRGAWKTAYEIAELPSRVVHDLRRTAVRNMVRSGILERVAMMISGHKTRAVFERYNIVSEGDLMAAAKKQEEYLKSQMGTVVKITTKKGSAKTG